MDLKVDKIIRVPCNKEDSLFNFFQNWMSFLRPIHNLNSNGIVVAACFLKHRYILSQAITDENILNRTLMSTNERKQIREECGFSEANFSIILKGLKTKQVITGDKLNPKYIPKVSEEKGTFQMLVLFDFKASS